MQFIMSLNDIYNIINAQKGALGREPTVSDSHVIWLGIYQHTQYVSAVVQQDHWMHLAHGGP